MQSFFNECVLYLIWGGIVQFICAALAAPVLYLVAIRVSRAAPEALVRRYVILNGFLLLWGCLGNYFFLSMYLDSAYWSYDRMVDCYPFIPFGQWVLDRGFGDQMRGHLIGDTTLWDLRLGWLAVAVPVWILSLVSTAITGRWFPATVVQRSCRREWSRV
ncbi:MAG: hypothetical protein EOP88_18630 [Verrucomicrobiaceae bacterium]|nr:MAG: hypothetical protein EOP88_18630 [Verrucomicrobiaceae bacterium]